MAQKIVDISKYINNDAPQMVLFGKTYTVKNDKKTILLLNELQSKEHEDADEKIIKLLVGKEDGAEICEIINKSANYNENTKIIMLNLLSLATGQDYEVLEQRFQNAIK
jgi:hypothetical protein